MIEDHWCGCLCACRYTNIAHYICQTRAALLQWPTYRTPATLRQANSMVHICTVGRASTGMLVCTRMAGQQLKPHQRSYVEGNAILHCWRLLLLLAEQRWQNHESLLDR